MTHAPLLTHRLQKKHRLYHWVLDRRVPAENNYVERELRPTVIARKVSFGSQSENGATTRSVLMTILHTAAKRLKNQSLQVCMTSVGYSIQQRDTVFLIISAFIPRDC